MNLFRPVGLRLFGFLAMTLFFLGLGLSPVAQAAGATTFTNPTTVTLNGDPGSPYPSSINVSGVTGTVSRITVTLTNFSHVYPGDIDIILVGPTGQKAWVMSDVGYNYSVNNVTLTFDDNAASSLSSSMLTAGTFKPTNLDDGDGTDIFPAPAPAGPYATSFAGFSGLDPNGTWQLLARNDYSSSETGSISGWSLSIYTAAPPVAKFAVSGFPSPTKVGSAGSFTVTAKDAGGATVTGYTGTVNLTSSDSQISGLPASYTFVAGDNGTHTFTNVAFNTAGMQSLTATDSSNSEITGSQNEIEVVKDAPPPPPPGTPGYASDPKPGENLTMGANLGGSARRSLLVSETGSAALTISNPQITGVNAREFAIISPSFPLTIEDGGAAQEITVQCSPAETGKRRALLTLTTNDPTQPTVNYSLVCGVEDDRKPADLVVQLRVTPDRTAKNDPATEIKFELNVKNVGPGEGGAVRLMFPIDRNLVPAFTNFSDPQMWVSELVTEGENPYMKIAVPAMQPNQSYSATLVFHPKGGLKDGTLIREQFTAGWDDAVHAGMSSTSNAVTVRLSDEQGDRDDTKGAVMWFTGHGQKVALGKSIVLTGDFYTPEEAVDFWYSDAAGNSVQLGKFWADKKGKISLEFSTTGLKEGQVYTIVGKGRRSGIMGSAAITVIAASNGDGDQPKAPVEGLK